MVLSFFSKNKKEDEKVTYKSRSSSTAKPAQPAAKAPPPKKAEDDASDIVVETNEDSAVIDQIVMLFANGDFLTTRTLLESNLYEAPTQLNLRYWWLMLDLLQVEGDHTSFDTYAMDFARHHETSPPAWHDLSGASVDDSVLGDGDDEQITLQGDMTQEQLGSLAFLTDKIKRNQGVILDFTKLVSCDDMSAGFLADALIAARKKKVMFIVRNTRTYLKRQSLRLLVGKPENENIWRLVLELFQRVGPKNIFEDRAVDYAITFEQSPPSWEDSALQEGESAVEIDPLAEPEKKINADGEEEDEVNQSLSDTVHYRGDLLSETFDDLQDVVDHNYQTTLDFAMVRRVDFFSAGSLLNKLIAFQPLNKKIVIFHPNAFVRELFRIVGVLQFASIVNRNE